MLDPLTPNSLEIPQDDQNRKPSDEAMAILFQTHISICINSANLVWYRFYIMVITNSIIFGFLANKAYINYFEMRVGSILGILLCTGWAILIHSEWNYFDLWMRLSQRFSWTTLPVEANPHAPVLLRGVRMGKWAKWTAHLMILSFGLAYVVLFCNTFGLF